jgi:hypothetical protein
MPIAVDAARDMLLSGGMGIPVAYLLLSIKM